MKPDRRTERDRIHGCVLEQILVALVCARHVEPPGGGGRPSGHRIAHGGEEDSILHVLERQMGERTPDPDAAGAHDAYADPRRHDSSGDRDGGSGNRQAGGAELGPTSFVARTLGQLEAEACAPHALA